MGTRIQHAVRRGFTLVEILAVVVIIGIASAIIVPQMGTRDDMRVAAAARVVIADLIYAQNLAISNGAVVYVKFDTANQRYTLLSTANSGGDVALSHPIRQTSYIQQFGSTSRDWPTTTINSADFDGLTAAFADQYTVAFDEIGAPYVFKYSTNTTEDLNTGSIVMRCGAFTKTISITAATGEITVQ
jgi:prepilin-type N-terminal cleavage/methylation domain-containing protein